MNETDPQHPWRQWTLAAARPEVAEALVGLYDRLDREIAARGPTCWLSGRCCHFSTYGHRLYVTGLEIAWLWRQLADAKRQAVRQAETVGELAGMDGCPFQVKGICGVHAVRPLGCRIYFCDPAAREWQSPVYEAYLDDLRTLHERHGLTYAYMEWRTGLGEVARSTVG